MGFERSVRRSRSGPAEASDDAKAEEQADLFQLGLLGGLVLGGLARLLLQLLGRELLHARASACALSTESSRDFVWGGDRLALSWNSDSAHQRWPSQLAATTRALALHVLSRPEDMAAVRQCEGSAPAASQEMQVHTIQITIDGYCSNNKFGETRRAARLVGGKRVAAHMSDFMVSRTPYTGPVC